ncbi:MAG TPA: tetratricopeptide repeat protein, partial [Verrucomicrobiae bacterium]|nr:tetratricopeptide repeat protein [Verrucomicrobiae bacterium]
MTSKKRSNPPGDLHSAGPANRVLASPVLMSLALAVCTLAVFGCAAWNEFVNYDDPDYVTSNPHVQSGFSWDNVIWAFTTGHASNWHPLTWLSHMFDCQVFGQSPVGPHLVNVAFHVANAVLLFLLLRRLTGAHWASAFVAALFALHPEHVESVAWVSERKDVLSTFFLLLTITAYARFAASRSKAPPAAAPERPRVVDLSGTKFYFASLLCFALGLMSKPMLVTVPFLLLLLDWWPLRRLEFQGGKGATSRLQLILEKIPFFALSIGSCVVTYVVQRRGGAVSTSLTVGQRIANALVSYARYIGKTVWPQNLSVLYPHPGDWSVGPLVLAAAVLLAISVLVVVRARARPYLAVGWLWFLGALVPVIGLVQVGIQSMADRYTYVPAIGLYIMAAWGASEALPKFRRRATFLAGGALLALGLCGLLTVRQIQYWRTSETLFRRATQVTDKNYLAYNNLGFYLEGRGKVDEAMEDYREALRINPRYEDALNNLGYALAGRKRPAEAIPLYEAALRIRPNHVEVHNNLGNALSEVGRVQEAMD